MSEQPQRVTQPTLLALTNITKIAAAGRHSYALTTNEVWAWGDNANGNLGLNSYEEVVKTPQRIALRVSNLASSSSHAFAWNETEVYGWGSNLNFELGLKETKHYPITKLQYFQQAFDGGFRVLHLAAGESHSLAVVCMNDNKKRLFAWGNGKAHQLTVDSNYLVPYPILCEFDKEVDRVYANSDYSVAVVGTEIYSWGSDVFGRLGMQINSKVQKTPKKIAVQNVISVGVGEYHATACLENGEAWSWGHGLYGQLGTGRLTNQGKGLLAENTPSKMQLEVKIIEVACGQQHTLLLTTMGEVYSCGSNAHCCLGHSETDKNKLCIIPRKTKLDNIRQVCAGSKHSMALTHSRQVYCWGDNSQGQLGLADGPIEMSESQTSIQLGVSPRNFRAPGLEESISIKLTVPNDEVDRKRKLRDWHVRYKQFQQRKALEEKALMDELDELLQY